MILNTLTVNGVQEGFSQAPVETKNLQKEKKSINRLLNIAFYGKDVKVVDLEEIIAEKEANKREKGYVTPPYVYGIK